MQARATDALSRWRARDDAESRHRLPSPHITKDHRVSSSILRLALPSPLRRLFDYLPPAGVSPAALQPGVGLRVPCGRGEVVAILGELRDHSEVPAAELKPALGLLDSK